jgi:hypothetical protein
MQLNTYIEEEANFARWQLQIGHGQVGDHTIDECNI